MLDKRLIALIILKRKVRLYKDTVPVNYWQETLGIVPQKINRLIKARVKGVVRAPVVWQQTAPETLLGARLNRDDIVKTKSSPWLVIWGCLSLTLRPR